MFFNYACIILSKKLLMRGGLFYIMEAKNKRLFLVDDNAVNLSVGKSVLQNKYTVVTMSSGEELLLMLDNTSADLILLDIEMPGMNGYEVIEKLKENPSTTDIPVIFLTGKNNPADELKGLSLGAVDYISKPFSPPLLLKRIDLHLLLEEQKKELLNFNENLKEMVLERTKTIDEMQKAILLWAAELIEFRDDATGKHVERVQMYLKALLSEMTKSERYALKIAEWDVDIDLLLQSSALHDIGKIKIKDDILLKPARLTASEYERMKEHTVYGKILIGNLKNRLPDQKFLDYAQIMAFMHHERWDGSGYPRGLKGEEIPLQARLMALADVYDALISKRAYKEPYSHELALSIIERGKGTQFDPELVHLFMSVSDTLKEIGQNR